MVEMIWGVMSSPYHFFKKGGSMSQEYVKQKAEMLLSNFDSHSKGVKIRILEMLVESGMSETELMYYARHKRWPDSYSSLKSADDFISETMQRIQQPAMARRKRAAIRNIGVCAALLLAIFLGLSVMIFSSDDSSSKAVDAIPIEESASTVKDGDSL